MVQSKRGWKVRRMTQSEIDSVTSAMLFEEYGHNYADDDIGAVQEMVRAAYSVVFDEYKTKCGMYKGKVIVVVFDTSPAEYLLFVNKEKNGKEMEEMVMVRQDV